MPPRGEQTHLVIFGGRLVAATVTVVALGGCATTSTTPVSRTAGSRPPSSSPSPTSSGNAPKSPPCQVSQLSVRLGVGGAAAGTSYQQIDFRNVGTTTCVLSGYPTVVFLDPAGQPVGQPAAPMNLLGTPIGPVELAAGQVGHASLGVATAQNYPAATCKPATTSTIRVSVPGDSATTTIHDRETVCSTGPTSTLITPFRPGQTKTPVG